MTAGNTPNCEIAGGHRPPLQLDHSRSGKSDIFADDMVETFKNFIGGKWATSRSGATFENENPACRGSNLGLFQSSIAEDVAEAIAAADGAFGTWRRTALSQRQQHIAEFLRLLKESREEIARIVTLRSEEHTSELQSHLNLVCRLL